MRILYIGYQSGVFLDRYKALKRLGHEVVLMGRDAWVITGNPSFQDWWSIHTASFGIKHFITRQMISRIPAGHFDVAWVDTNPFVSVAVLEQLRKQCTIIIHYNQDDPFGLRDGYKWKMMLTTLPLYDMVVVLREPNISEARNLGARNVLRVFFAADEFSHAPRLINDSTRRLWNTDVLFIGTWFPERGSFLLGLIERGIPLTIIGDRWQKAPEWPKLKPYFRTSHLRGDEYAYAIQSAKICIGLLSKGNRDLHTTRSLEIPSLGGLLCAERTKEHLEMYVEDEEAVFWSSLEECALKCELLLKQPDYRRLIAKKGHDRFIANGLTNENVCRDVLNAAGLLVRNRL